LKLVKYQEEIRKIKDDITEKVCISSHYFNETISDSRRKRLLVTENGIRKIRKMTTVS